MKIELNKNVLFTLNLNLNALNSNLNYRFTFCLQHQLNSVPIPRTEFECQRLSVFSSEPLHLLWHWVDACHDNRLMIKIDYAVGRVHWSGESALIRVVNSVFQAGRGTCVSALWLCLWVLLFWCPVRCWACTTCCCRPSCYGWSLYIILKGTALDCMFNTKLVTILTSNNLKLFIF